MVWRFASVAWIWILSTRPLPFKPIVFRPPSVMKEHVPISGPPALNRRNRIDDRGWFTRARHRRDRGRWCLRRCVRWHLRGNFWSGRSGRRCWLHRRRRRLMRGYRRWNFIGQVRVQPHGLSLLQERGRISHRPPRFVGRTWMECLTREHI